MDATALCPAPDELWLERIVLSRESITLVAIARRVAVPCPTCGLLSQRVPSRYVRTLDDLPWHGVRVRIEAHVRKFCCEAPSCPRRIFTERLSETTVPYARRTSRAAAALELIGFALGGRPGERLAMAMGLAGGAWAMLERVREAPEESIVAPRVLGVDDWAIRRGQRYGTLLTDLERHSVIDMLADREAQTLGTWLTAHPGVEIISRDRGGAYAEGARHGAPDAIQVADRFHLLKNLMEALERACTRHHAALGKTAAATHPKPLPKEAVRTRRYSGLPHHRPGPTTGEQRSTERRARRLARDDEVVALRQGGMPRHRIAERVGLDRRTVSVWLAAGGFPERVERARRPHRLDAYAEYIDGRYDIGLENAAQLLRELRERGYSGPYQTVLRYLAEMRRTRPRGVAGGTPTGVLQRPIAWGHAPAPSPRETAWLLHNADAKPEKLSAEERAYVEALGSEFPELATCRRLVTEFAEMRENQDANALETWLVAAGESELKSFAARIRRDDDAVLAALLFQWSKGQVEGQVNRVKLIKRSMYGRAGFALLRKRVLRAA